MMQTGRNSAKGRVISWLDRQLFGEMEAGEGRVREWLGDRC